MKVNRPTPVTVICMFLLVLSAANFVVIAAGLWQSAAERVFTVPTAGAGALIGLVVTTVCAFFMLRGANWARWVYLGWVGAGTIAAFFIARSPVLLLAIVKTCGFAYFLTRRDANLFFRRSRDDTELNSNAT